MDLLQSTTDTGPIAELFKIKSKLEQSIADLNDEKKSLKNRLKILQDEKEGVRKAQSVQFQRQYQLKIELVDVQRGVDTLVKSVDGIRQMMRDSEESILKIVELNNFDENVKSIRESTNGAIDFYSEDSLRLETLKRTNINREKRVELTRLSAEYENKLKQLEEAKKEMERRRQIEIENERQRQEMRERIEQERISADKERQRDDFLKRKYVPMEASMSDNREMPFRNVSFKTCSPEPESRPSLSAGEAVSSLSGSESVSFSNIAPKYINGLPSLSQFTRW